MKLYIAVFISLMLWIPVSGQSPDVITLDYCYERIQNEFPLTRKTEIQQKIADLNVRLRQTALYPELELSGSVSYQSEVTEVPFGGANAPIFSKDHYRIALDVSQAVFDAGKTGSLKELELRKGLAERAGVKAELWEIRKQVDQVYFGILLMQKQKQTVELLLNDLNEQLKNLTAKVENGVMLRGNSLAVEAEILKVRQQLAGIESNIEAGYEVLSELTGEKISKENELLLPGDFGDESLSVMEGRRPEYEMFEARKKVLDSQIKLADADKLPVVSAFATTAYGRPGFDVFNDDLHFFWMVGLRARWSFRNWRNAGDKARIVRMQQQEVNAEMNAFTRQLNASFRRSEALIQALKQQIELDEQLLDLRDQIVKEKQSQLNQGVITSTEYLTELNAQSRTRLNLEIHKVQLVQANYEYLTKRGISW